MWAVVLMAEGLLIEPGRAADIVQLVKGRETVDTGRVALGSSI